LRAARAAVAILWDAFEIVQDLWDADTHELGTSPLRLCPLILIIETNSYGVMAIVGFDNQIAEGKLQLLRPESPLYIPRHKSMPLPQIL
jgi:hypothetical protein